MIKIKKGGVLIAYTLQKKWYAFWQNYQLKSGDKLFLISYDKPYLENDLILNDYLESNKPVFVKMKNKDVFE